MPHGGCALVYGLLRWRGYAPFQINYNRFVTKMIGLRPFSNQLWSFCCEDDRTTPLFKSIMIVLLRRWKGYAPLQINYDRFVTKMTGLRPFSNQLWSFCYEDDRTTPLFKSIMIALLRRWQGYAPFQINYDRLVAKMTGLRPSIVSLKSMDFGITSTSYNFRHS
jgi:hypothetical protein